MYGLFGITRKFGCVQSISRRAVFGIGSWLLLGWAATEASAAVFSAVGANAAAIQAAVDAFRADLGANNGVGPGATPGVGRREVNWDAVPDSFSSGGANAFPGNFFNLSSGNPAGRVRGIEFSTTGQFEVSADADSDNDSNPGPTEILFGNRNLGNVDDFAAFSSERIFGLVGTNEMDVRFSKVGDPTTSATVRGFGAVFTDVEDAGSTRLDFYDRNNNLIDSQAVPAFAFTGGDSGKSFSFLGVSFPNADVHRVHIVNGGFDLKLQQFGADDAVAMDDFIYGEPVPEPAAVHLALLAAVGLGARLRFTRRSRLRR